MTDFDKNFVEMWTFACIHFNHGLEYEYDSIEYTFTLFFQSDEERSFFLLHWGDKIAAV